MIIEPCEEKGPGWYILHDGWNMFPRPISAWHLLEIKQWIEKHESQLMREVKEEEARLAQAKQEGQGQ